jgi:tetratricopeptide (TPR) repeat protein
MNRGVGKLQWKNILRLSGVVAAVVLCLLGMNSVFCVGEARSLASNSFQNRSLVAATDAVQLSPDDPQGYVARAFSLLNVGELDLALDDLRRAVALRPKDYKLWTELGTSLAKKGDTAGALTALTEAESRAPFYAQPHWEAGLVLQKLGRQDEAFREFRAATLTQPALLPKVTEMAWVAYARDCKSVQAAVDPRTDQERLALAHFFISNGKPVEALSLIRLVNALFYYDRQQLLVEFLSGRQYAQAYELWTMARKKNPSTAPVGTIDDGGFESRHLSDEAGFTWRVNQIAGTNLTIVDSARSNGNHSLRIDWKGNSDPGEEVVSQLILIEPNTRYRLSFVGRSQDLVTSGAPVLTVTDVSQREEKRIASSDRMPIGTSGWQNISFSFTTASSTLAVRIGVRRESCAQQPCQIFGTLWLDDFSLSKDLGKDSRSEVYKVQS